MRLICQGDSGKSFKRQEKDRVDGAGAWRVSIILAGIMNLCIFLKSDIIFFVKSI